MMQYAYFFFILPTMMPLLVCEQKYPPSATTLHFEFYAEPGPEVKVERKVKTREINLCSHSLKCRVTHYLSVCPSVADQ